MFEFGDGVVDLAGLEQDVSKTDPRLGVARFQLDGPPQRLVARIRIARQGLHLAKFQVVGSLIRLKFHQQLELFDGLPQELGVRPLAVRILALLRVVGLVDVAQQLPHFDILGLALDDLIR